MGEERGGEGGAKRKWEEGSYGRETEHAGAES